MSAARTAAGVAAYTLGAVALTAGMFALHVGTAPGRAAVRDVANAVLAGTFQGRLHIGEVTELHLRGRLVARGVTLTDAQGRLIADGGELVAGPVDALWTALVHPGRGPMPRAALHVRTLRFYADPQGLPSIAGAFALRNPPPPPPAGAAAGPPPPTYRFPALALSVDRFENHLGIAATATGLSAHGALVTEPIALDAVLNPDASPPAMVTTDRTPPLRLRGEFDWRARFVVTRAGQPAEDMGRMHALAVLEGDGGMRCRIELVRDAGATRLTADDCRAPAGAIDRIAAAPMGLDSEVEHAELAQAAAAGSPWTIAARGAVQSQRFDARATLGLDGDGSADVTLAHADLARVRAGLPSTDLDGTLHIERHGATLTADTSRMNAFVQHTRVPPVRATARIAGNRLALDRLALPELGLTVNGEADLAHPDRDAWAEVHFDNTDLGRVPLVGGVARGVVSGEARAELSDGQLVGHFAVRGRAIRAQGVSVASGEAHGRLALEHGAPWLDADLRASGVVAGGNGPLEVRGHVAGNPRRSLDGRLHADATAAVARGRFPGGAVPQGAPGGGSTAFDGAFHVRVGRDQLHVAVPDATVSLRGARGRLHADIDVPTSPGAGAIAGHARVETEGGGVADVGIRGTDVTGRFQGFPLAWAGRALGTTAPLSGTLEGDLGILTNRAGNPRGTLRWIGGRLPYIGAFDLDVRANHERDVSELGATLTFGDDRASTPTERQHRVVATLHVVPPHNLGDLPGWLAGLRDADVEAHNVPGSVLHDALPRVARVDGTLDATLTAHRRSAEAPLDAVLGFDARNVALGWSLRAALPDALRSLLRAQAPRRGADADADDSHPLTVPLRARGAVCTRLEGSAIGTAPLTLDTVLSLEAGEPVIPLPTSCTDPTIAAATQPLARASGSLEGRWLDGATRTIAEYAAGLAAGHALDAVTLSPGTLAALGASRADVTLDVTADSSRWPFVAENVRPLVPSLARPPLPGRAHVVATVRGTLAAPTVAADVQLHTAGLEALVGRDELAVTAHASITPRGTTVGPLGAVLIGGTADARLIAYSGQTTRDAGTAHADVQFGGVLARLLTPNEGLRYADFKRFEITTSQLHIGQLRWARSNNMSGLLTLRVSATGDANTPVRLGAEITRFSARTEQALAARADAFVRNNDGTWEIEACTVASTENGGQSPPTPCDPDAADLPPTAVGGLRAAVILPLQGAISAMRLDPTGVHVELAANRFRLEPLAPFVEVPPIVRVGGELTTRLSWAASSPRVITGNLSLADGLLDLESIGAPAHDIALDVTLHARRAEITRLAFGLGNGTLRAHGTAQIAAEGDRVADVSLQARADHLPALQEGNNYGDLTGDVEGDLAFRTDGMRGNVRVVRAQVLVPEQSSRDLQSLDPNPDVFVMGETRINVRESTHPYPIDLDFSTRNPVIAARNDLYIGVHANGHIHYDPAGLALSGSVNQAVNNSWFNIFGKRFDFDRISILFDGSTVFDPILDIAAHYDSPTAGRINVLVSDRESSPDIRFTSEQYPDLGQSEVLALLILGRRDTRGAADQTTISQQAQDAAAALLTGLLAGLGTNALRQQFDFLPQIIAEPGANGTGRYGAGVTELNGRLYIEATYGTSNAYSGALNSAAQTTTTSPEFRVLTEYNLSRHWSVSGQAGTLQRYGADLFWSP